MHKMVHYLRKWIKNKGTDPYYKLVNLIAQKQFSEVCTEDVGTSVWEKIPISAEAAAKIANMYKPGLSAEKDSVSLGQGEGVCLPVTTLLQAKAKQTLFQSRRQTPL